MRALIEEKYGYLFEEALIDEIVATGARRQVSTGTVLIHLGDPVQLMPLLLTGVIRILREDEAGNEMFLYYLEQGDTCAMTLNCCLKNQKSEITAIVEEDSELIMIPVEYLDNWMDTYKSWRTFILTSYKMRFQEMLEAFDSVVFMKMDERLLKYLNDKVKVTGSTAITNTHQEIATELNTSRVVVSRLLKQLELQGRIKLHRNKLELLDF
jgi:CRP/FNR family transcriptional regulator